MATLGELSEIRIFTSDPDSALIMCPRCKEGLLELKNVGSILTWCLTHNEGMCYGEAAETEAAIIPGNFGEGESESPEEAPEGEHEHSDGTHD